MTDATPELPFRIADHGQYYNVVIVDNWVIKCPRVHAARKNIERQAEIQNDLADNIDGCLPCQVINNDCTEAIVMPRAPGVRADHVSYTKWRPHEERIVVEAAELGYELEDTSPKNFFWDDDREMAYLVDYSSIEPIEG